MKPRLPLYLAGTLFLLTLPVLSYSSDTRDSVGKEQPPCDSFGSVGEILPSTGNCSPTIFWNYGECSQNVVYYIQYSNDNVNYGIVAEVTGNGSGYYTWMDDYAHPQNPAAATVYYRVIYYNTGTGLTIYSPVFSFGLGAATCTNNSTSRCTGLPSLSINGPTGICIESGPSTYTISGNPPFPITWSLGYNGSYVTLTQTLASASVTNSSNATGGYFTLIANEEGCDVISSNIYLGIPPAPTVISPANGTSVKPSNTYDFYSAPANVWNVTNGTIISGGTTNNPEIKPANMVGSTMTVTAATQDICGTSPHLIYQYPISNSGGGGTSFSPDASAGSNTGFGFSDKLGVYPNPVTNSVQVTIAAVDYTKSYIKLYDLNGRLLKMIIPTGQTTLVDMSKQAQGIYIMEIFDGKQRTIQKVVRL